jgi:hypothetical protein
VLLAPAAALPLGCWVELALELVEPPAADWSFFSAVGAALEDALEELDWSFFWMSTDREPEAAPGALGVVVEPAEEDAEPEGGVVRDTARSPASLSQPVSNPAPSARETATAKVESLMCGPPWLGYQKSQQGSGPSPAAGNAAALPR